MSLSLTPRYLGVPLQVQVWDIDFSWQTRVVTEMGSELDYGVVYSMGGCTEFCLNGVCSELGFGEFLELNAKDYVPLHITGKVMLSTVSSRSAALSLLPNAWVLYCASHILSRSEQICSKSARNGRNGMSVRTHPNLTRTGNDFYQIPTKFRPVRAEWLGSARFPILVEFTRILADSDCHH